MKALACAVLLVLMTGAGCVELPLLRQVSQTPARAKRTQPVSADEVTADNAHEIADALRDELDREQAPTSK